MTYMDTVSIQLFTVHRYLYTPVDTKCVTVVVADAGFVIVVTTGLLDSCVHVPVPRAAIVTVLFKQMVWFGPPFGWGVTITLTVSGHPPDVQR